MTLSKAEKEKKALQRQKETEEAQRRHEEMMARPPVDPGEWTNEKFESYLGHLPEDADVVKGKIASHAENMVFEMFTIGRWLLYLKKLLPHGELTPYFREECPFSERSARFFMNAAIWEEKHPNYRSELPRLRKLSKTQLYSLFGALEQLGHTENIIEGKGPIEIPNIDALAVMTARKKDEVIRELAEQARRGGEQLRKRDQENRELQERVLIAEIGPKTDREFVERCKQIQSEVILAPAQLRTLMPYVKTSNQAEALIATVVYMEKQWVLVAEEIQRVFDPTYDGFDAGLDIIQHKPDGINWYHPDVFRFLKEYTRKAREDVGEFKFENVEKEIEKIKIISENENEKEIMNLVCGGNNGNREAWPQETEMVNSAVPANGSTAGKSSMGAA